MIIFGYYNYDIYNGDRMIFIIWECDVELFFLMKKGEVCYLEGWEGWVYGCYVKV